MTEWGIFNDEGLIEGQFYDSSEAARALRERYSDDEWAVVRPVCPDHPEQPQDACEECDRDA